MKTVGIIIIGLLSVIQVDPANTAHQAARTNGGVASFPRDLTSLAPSLNTMDRASQPTKDVISLSRSLLSASKLPVSSYVHKSTEIKRPLPLSKRKTFQAKDASKLVRESLDELVLVDRAQQRPLPKRKTFQVENASKLVRESFEPVPVHEPLAEMVPIDRTQQRHYGKLSRLGHVVPDDPNDFIFRLILQKEVIKQKVIDKDTFASCFFGVSPEGDLHGTHRPGNPLITANPERLAHLLKAIELKKVEEFIASKEVTQWHQDHFSLLQRFSKKTDFNKELRKFVKECEKYDDQEVRDYFGLFAHLKFDTTAELEVYYQARGVKYQKEDFVLKSIEPKDLTKMSKEQVKREYLNAVVMLIQKGDLSVLSTPPIQAGYKGQVIRPLCVEEAVRSVLNAILYDPESKKFTLSNLPKDLQISERLKEFIEKHPDPSIEGYYKNSAEDWLNVVSDLQGVTYHNNSDKGNYEVNSGQENVVAVLNRIFNVECKSLKEFGNKVSTDKRKVTLEKSGENITGEKFKLEVNEGDYKASGILGLYPMHGSFALDQAASKDMTLEQAKYILDLSKHISKDDTLLSLVKDEALFKFLEDAIEMKKPEWLKEVLDAKPWDLNIVNVRNQNLLQVAQRDHSVLKVFFDIADKKGEFAPEYYQQALLSANKNTVKLLLDRIEEKNIQISMDTYDKMLYKGFGEEVLKQFLDFADKKGVECSPQAYERALTYYVNSSLNFDVFKFLLDRIDKKNIKIESKTLSQILDLHQDSQIGTLVFEFTDKKGIELSADVYRTILQRSNNNLFKLLLDRIDKKNIEIGERIFNKVLYERNWLTHYNYENFKCFLDLAHKKSIAFDRMIYRSFLDRVRPDMLLLLLDGREPKNMNIREILFEKAYSEIRAFKIYHDDDLKKILDLADKKNVEFSLEEYRDKLLYRAQGEDLMLILEESNQKTFK